MARKIATELTVVAALLLGTAGCRGVLGIEELTLDDGSVSEDGSVQDTGIGDASGDGASDAVAPVDAGGFLQCADKCRDGGGSGSFFDSMHTCICKGSTPQRCANECSNFCPSNSASGACQACILTEYRLGNCTVSGCSTSCQAFASCVKACP